MNKSFQSHEVHLNLHYMNLIKYKHLKRDKIVRWIVTNNEYKQCTIFVTKWYKWVNRIQTNENSYWNMKFENKKLMRWKF